MMPQANEFYLTLILLNVISTAVETSLAIFRLSSFRFSLSQLLAAFQLFEIP
jgi:hypothetical protein